MTLVYYNSETDELWLYDCELEYATQGEYNIFYKCFLDWTELGDHWIMLGEL